jgi:hypothetical protein
MAMLGSLPRTWAFLLVTMGQASEARGFLTVDPTGRFLVDQVGKPFLVVGDTAWSLIVQPDPKDIVRYLDDRRRRGFNSIIVNLIEHKFCSNAPGTRAGLAPFRQPGDFGTPSPEYFDFAHGVVKRANDRGIVVWLAPAYLGSGGGDEGWFRHMKASGPGKIRAYGRFVGERFKDLPNIVWLLGGDFTPRKEDQWTVTEVAQGIRETDPKHLMSGHGTPGPSAVEAFGDQPWLAVNSAYSYDPNLFRPMLDAYLRKPTRPFVLIESVYEGEHDAKPEQIRRQAYWAMLSGACGQFFGNNPIWRYDGPGLFPAKTSWQEALDGIGSCDMSRLRGLFARLPWYHLIPEEKHVLVVDGFGQGTATALTALTADRRLSVTYVPSTGTGPRTLKVDLGQISGRVKARWFNPSSGQDLAIEDPTIVAARIQPFRTPGDNGTGTNDWVLILEAR